LATSLPVQPLEARHASRGAAGRRWGRSLDPLASARGLPPGWCQPRSGWRSSRMRLRDNDGARSHGISVHDMRQCGSTDRISVQLGPLGAGLPRPAPPMGRLTAAALHHHQNGSSVGSPVGPFGQIRGTADRAGTRRGCGLEPFRQRPRPNSVSTFTSNEISARRTSATPAERLSHASVLTAGERIGTLG
jgi:hypothetical protein